MNEELEKIAQDMRRKERELWAGNPPRMGNGAAIHTALDSVRIEMLKRLAGIQPQISDMGILELCVDAQHKPPRNCDRFATWLEAWDAFVEENGGPSETFGVWLFAPEGGAR